MKISFNKNKKATNFLNIKIFLPLFFLAFLFLLPCVARASLGLQPVIVSNPTLTVTDPAVPVVIKQTAAEETFLDKTWKAIQKSGSIALHKTLASALNKIAYDAANYIGSGGEGQSALFVKQTIGDYLTDIGDEAAGEFIESFVNNWNTDTTKSDKCWKDFDSCKNDCDDRTIKRGQTSCIIQCNKTATDCASNLKKDSSRTVKSTPSFNVCAPSSIEAKVRIGLGLVQYQRPAAPNCSASQMIKSWEEWGDDLSKKYGDFKNPNFLNIFNNIFDPSANDLGIYMMARSDMIGKIATSVSLGETGYNTSGGWLDVRNIAGEIEGVPGEAQRRMNEASEIRQQALGKTTGDILVDAANVFLNQLYIASLNNLLSHLGEKSSSAKRNTSISYEADPSYEYGEKSLQKQTTSLLQLRFDTQADYDAIAKLSICLNQNNPGPDECVIDDRFAQAISNKLTVKEAIDGGYLNSSWLISADKQSNYKNAYTLRNISILRKYRILPLGWEEAAQKISSSSSPRQATLLDLISCFSDSDDYQEYSNGFNVSDQSWCRNLIDPNWVLKSPLNYCRKEGVGSQILSQSIIPSSGKDENYTPSSLSLSRADGYCADNQTCIKERSDGSCELYGYCNSEKRTWNFSSNSCPAIYNSCQSFTSSRGADVSYLKNTIDYGNCNADNAGCTQYSWGGTYNASTSKISWSDAYPYYYNSQLKSCSGENASCHELVRLKPTWGANLVMSASFSNDKIGDRDKQGKLNDWPIYWNGNSMEEEATIVDVNSEPGGGQGKAIKFYIDPDSDTVYGGLYSDNSHSLLPKNLQLISGYSYTLSADVFLMSGDKISLIIGSGDTAVESSNQLGSWQRLSVTRLADGSFGEPSFRIIGESSATDLVYYVKDIKFEISNFPTNYSNYAYLPSGSGRIYEKLLPDYLESSCYRNLNSSPKDYSFKTNAPAACYSYARKCNKEEVGCNIYTSAGDNSSVTARAVNSDYCSSKCLGYDSYVVRGTYFNSLDSENIIPKNSQKCSAASVGCNEFTNLDEVSAGGEGREYYSSLRQCIKPDDSLCGVFYSWETEESGPQLKSYNLKKNSSGQIVVTSNDAAECNEAIFSLPTDDPRYNSDCHQFYNTAGQISYHLLTRTISCSDNCHPYRLSSQNIDKTILSAAACQGSDKHWEASSSHCFVCLNGGLWNEDSQACVYQAIPGEGESCRASENGCREYSGNQGANVRRLFISDFEDGLDNWSSICSGGVSQSVVSSEKEGHSLYYEGGGTASCEETDNAYLKYKAYIDVSDLVSQGSSYSLKFLARSASNNNLQIYLWNQDTDKKEYFNDAAGNITIAGGNEWRLYQANLPELTHEVGSKEFLTIESDGNLYLDNFALYQITDRYYLIKGSSQIDNACYYDLFDNYQGPEYNLGCSQYMDRDGNRHNLRQFSSLCADSAVGCEQMIDTHNYTSYKSRLWNDDNGNGVCDSDEDSCRLVSGDEAIYAVYDDEKLCSSGSKGCSYLGKKDGLKNLSSWQDVYMIDNPDYYDSSLCRAADVGCESWNSGAAFFKNPGYNTCQYRSGSNGKTWYMIPAKRCDLNGNRTIDKESEGLNSGQNICYSNDDCQSGGCLVDNNDYPCQVSPYKTIGDGAEVRVPDGLAGLCDSNYSGCTEYIDPLTEYAPNLVVDPDFSAGYGWGNRIVKWGNNSVSLESDEQEIKLEKNRLYRFVLVSGDNNGVKLNFLSNVKPLIIEASEDNNKYGEETKILTPSSGKALIFNSLDNQTAILSGGTNGRDFEIKQLSVNYQLEQSIDKTSCKEINFDNGCVLFSERKIVGYSGYAKNKYDASSTNNGSPVPCGESGECSANSLIKVKPDRVCASWYDCTSYIKDPETGEKTCYAFGECRHLDDQNVCDNYSALPSSSGLQNHSFNAETDKNSTGYSLLGYYPVNQMREVGYDAGLHEDFEGKDISSFDCINSQNCHSDIVSEPVSTPTKPMADYPAHNSSYLRVNGDDGVVVSEVSLSGAKDNDYYLNYLASTKDSGLQGKIMITDIENKVLKDLKTGKNLEFFVSSDSWKRFVNKFSLAPQTVRVVASSDVTVPNQGRYVFFDDFNIEPVLEMGSGQYAAAECRLFATSDSLSCSKKESNAIKSGLEGYCLQHDQYNPANCLLWYPADRISAGENYVAGGYDGRIPLSFCTAADGKFKLVENREIEIYPNDWTTYINGVPLLYSGLCTSSLIVNKEDKFIAVRASFNTSVHNHAHCATGIWYLPIPSGNIHIAVGIVHTGVTARDDINKRNIFDYSLGSGQPILRKPVSNDSAEKINYIFTEPAKNISPETINFLGERNIIKVDSNNQLLYLTAYVDNDYSKSPEGWYEYDDNTAENNEKKTAEHYGLPPVMVYEPGRTSSTLWSLPGIKQDDYIGLSGHEPYRLKCISSSKLVADDGSNLAWADRVNNNNSSTTPLFLDRWRSASPQLNLQGYTREIANNPFGSMTSPKSSYFKDSQHGQESDFAGRPYGCEGANCLRFGYCSNAPDTYCITTQQPGDKFCGNGGACLPIWKTTPLQLSGYLPSYYNADYVLNNLFIKDVAAIPKDTCANNPRSEDEFCAIFPIVSNINLYYGDSNAVLNPSSNYPRGIYRLEFNSNVDKEQQPLKSIEINWGDGSSQVITGESARPDASRPHVIYHYYNDSNSGRKIKVKIIDNWFKYGESEKTYGSSQSVTSLSNLQSLNY